MTIKARPTLAWTEGKILPLQEISVPATDRSLEHGLGLFESMRGSLGRVPLWGLHRQRLIRSAQELGLRLNAPKLLDENDLSVLLEASGLHKTQARLRLTLAGGSGQDAGQLWVAAYPLAICKLDNLRLANDFWPVDERDRLAPYKTLNYWTRLRAFEAAQAEGADETLSVGQSRRIWEGARSTLFMIKNRQVIVPPRDGPRLQSVSEEALHELIVSHGSLKLNYRPITQQSLAGADEVFMTNAVRGLMTVERWRNSSYPSPGPLANELRMLWQIKHF